MKRMMLRGSVALSVAAMVLIAMMTGCSGSGTNTDTKEEYIGGQIGAITYSWRSMPSTPEDIIKYCKQTGITSLELMGNIAEDYAGVEFSAETPASELHEMMQRFPKTGEVKG